MLQEEPTNEFRDKSFQKYDAVVANAQLTNTTRQLAFAQKYQLWKDGLPIPPEILLADVDMQDKDKMIEGIKQQQEAQQQQQQQMAELQMENQRIVNESLRSKAMSDRALAQERIQKGHLEQFQIATAHNKSKHELASAHLDEIKAAKEVESMGVDDFVKVFTLIENITKRQDEKELKQQEVTNGTQP